MRRLFDVMVAGIIGVAAVGALYAQKASPSPSPASQGTTATSGEDTSLQENLQDILEEQDTGGYRYDPHGRRDPFRSLVGPSQRVNRENAPPGPAGFMIDELDLQGILQVHGGLVAMVQGPDNKGYLLRAGDKTFDGEVVRITPSSVVFRQEVNDPTRIERYREVVKEIGQPSGEQKR